MAKCPASTGIILPFKPTNPGYYENKNFNPSKPAHCQIVAFMPPVVGCARPARLECDGARHRHLERPRSRQQLEHGLELGYSGADRWRRFEFRGQPPAGSDQQYYGAAD